MSRLSALKEVLMRGQIPHGTVVRKNGQPRVPVIDDAVRRITEELGNYQPTSYARSMGNRKARLNPEQYEEVASQYADLVAALQDAMAILKALHRGRIEYSGKTTQLPYSVWPKHQKAVPHSAKIVDLRSMIGERIDPYTRLYHRWQSANKAAKEEIADDISLLRQSIAKAQQSYDGLSTVYAALERGMTAPSDGWYHSAAGMLGCDKDLAVILTVLPKREAAVAQSVRNIGPQSEEIRAKLATHLQNLSNPDEYVLTLDDIGAELGKGFQGQLEGALRDLSGWYQKPAGKATTLWDNGVTVGNNGNRALVAALQTSLNVEALLNGAANYESALNRMVLDIGAGNFTGRYSLSFDPQQASESIATAFATIDGSQKLRKYYEGKVPQVGGLSRRLGSAYIDGCEVLRQQSSGYLQMERVERFTLTSTKTGVIALIDQINAARRFSYGGIKPEQVVDEDTYGRLREFATVLTEAEQKLSPSRRETYRSMSKQESEFQNAMSHTQDEGQTYGWADNPLFRTAVVGCRQLADILPPQSDASQTTGMDRRVAHLFGSGAGSGGSIGDLLAKLQRWETSIREYKTTYGL